MCFCPKKCFLCKNNCNCVLGYTFVLRKLWRLHDNTEDRKIKLASSEFDGYALRWWDGIMTEIRETNGTPIRTWREMKETMMARFVPTNYLRTVFYKLQQLKQGTMTSDAYYMEMEMLLQHARVREDVEMTMQLKGSIWSTRGW